MLILLTPDDIQSTSSYVMSMLVSATPIPPKDLPDDMQAAVVRLVGGADIEAIDLIDRACQQKHGGDRRGDRKSDIVRLDETAHTAGNSEAYALRKLRKDRPDLHERVLGG